MSDTGTGWHRALAYALTGTDLAELAPRPAPDAAALGAELGAAGWDVAALRDHAADCRRSGRGWPHPVPAALAAGLPAAQFTAVLRTLVADWRLAVPGRRVRSATRPVRTSASDQRLLGELPPHFGKL